MEDRSIASTSVAKQGAAIDALIERCMGELLELATRLSKGRLRSKTAESLVQEAYIRLRDVAPPVSRTHFLHLAVRTMGQVVVDHLRRKKTLKRGKDRKQVDLDTIALAADEGRRTTVNVEFERLFLEVLPALPEDESTAIRLRFVANLSREEAAEAMGLSVSSFRVVCARAIRHVRAMEGA